MVRPKWLLPYAMDVLICILENPASIIAARIVRRMSVFRRSLVSFGFALSLLFMVGTACTSSSDDGETETGSSVTVPDSINTLSEAQQGAGWHLLFDGQTLDGWRGFARDSVPKGWTVEHGAIHFTGKTTRESGDPPATLMTQTAYDHFDLRFEWKISPEGNSGVLYRVTEAEDLPYETGPEYQIVDNAIVEDDAPTERAGALFGLFGASEEPPHAVGAYNESRIVVQGNHVEHWINGTKLVDVEIGSGAWTDRVTETKFANWPRFAQAQEGHIALQDHGYPVWFRDVKLRPLSPDSD